MGKNVISRRKFLGRTTAGIGLGLIGQSASVSALDLKSARDIKKLSKMKKLMQKDLLKLQNCSEQQQQQRQYMLTIT